jgi:hypothetical protein
MRTFKIKESKVKVSNGDFMVEEDEGSCNMFDTEFKYIIENVDMEGLGKLVFSTGDMLCRMKTGAALIDFAGPGKKVYKIASSDKQKLSVKGLEKLFLASGHIAKNKSGNYEVTDNEQIANINFYLVVPYGLERHWKNRVPSFKKNEKMDDTLKKLLKECFENYVVQYILVIDNTPLNAGIGFTNYYENDAAEFDI